jgi:hypothetical protein
VRVGPVGPSKTILDKNIAIGERDVAWVAGGVGMETVAGTGAGKIVESESQGKWDADDVMLFFWGNTQAAKEHHLKKAHDNTQRMELWRADIPHFSETF